MLAAPSVPPVALPRLDDDGQTVTLDLHGATVDEAVRLAEAAVVQAARYGRSSLRLIHGVSTWEGGDRRTIKGELHRLLDAGAFDRHVASTYTTEGALTFGIAPAPSPVTGRIRLNDLL